MDKEKSKNRTDLLAAGRKKLQQYRQKKDSKGSRHGKTSNKSGEVEHLDADVDAASVVAEPPASLLDPEEKVQSPRQEPISISVGNSVFSHTDIANAGPSSLAIPPERIVSETGAFHDHELSGDNPVVIGAEVDCLLMSGVNAQGLESEVARATSETSEMPVIEATSSHAHLLAVPACVDASEGVVAAAEATRVDREAQEADDVGSEKLDGSSKVELKEDGTTSERCWMTDITNKSEQSGAKNDAIAPFVVSNNSEGFSDHAQATDEPLNSVASSYDDIDQERVDQEAASSHQETFERVPESGNSEYSESEAVQADRVQMSMDEGCKQQYICEGSVLSEVNGNEEYMKTNLERLTSPSSVHPILNLSSVSLSQLAKVLRCVDEDDLMSLLNSRKSASNEVIDTCKLKLSGHASDVLETLKEQLYLSHIAKDLFYLQVSDQSELQMEFERHRHQLVDHISVLTASLTEAQEENRSLAEELAHYKSEIQAVTGRRDELQKLFDSAREEIEALSVASKELNRQLEISQGDMTILLTELADSKRTVADLQLENENLSRSLAFETQEHMKLVAEKESLSIENAILSSELHLKLEKSQADVTNLSAELADCKVLVTDIQIQNENLNGSLTLATQEKMEVAEQKEFLVIENERLLSELADHKNSVASLQLENSNLVDQFSFTNEERKRLEEKNGQNFCENEKLLAELTDCKGLVASLEAENAKLIERLSLVMEERKKFREDMECSVQENERLLLELLVHAQVLSTVHAERRQLELDLKEAHMHLEQFIGETSVSSCVQKPNLRETDSRQAHLVLPGGESECQFESSDAASVAHFSESGRGYPQQAFKGQNNEAFSHLFGKAVSDKLEDGSQLRQVPLDADDDSIGLAIFKMHLMEAEKILQKLDMTIEHIQSTSSSLNKQGGKVAAPGISKLIQAFELKAHIDDHESQELNLNEGQSSADPILVAREQSEYMRNILNQLFLDADNAGKLLKGDRERQEVANLTFDDLKDRHEALKNLSCNLEARNIELEVLYEIMKHHLSSIEHKNNKLGVAYEAMKEHEANLKAENAQLRINLRNYQSKINELSSHWHEIQQSSDEMASTMYSQLENLQKEASDRVLLLEKEWSSSVAQIAEATTKLDVFVEGSFASNLLPGTQDGFSIGASVAASMDSAAQVIKNLQGKIEAKCTDNELIRSSCNEVTKKYHDLLTENELALNILHKILSNLWKLVEDSSGYAVENETRIKNDTLINPLLWSNYEVLIKKLGDFMSAKVQLESSNSKLNLELMNKTKDFEELSRRCIDTRSLSKLIEDIEGVIKQEDGGGSSNEKPVSYLVSLVSILVHNYKDTWEKVQFLSEGCKSKVTELTDMEEKAHELYNLHLQHENEIFILKESLSQAERALVAVRSELQLKLTELEQSELRVSSLREKLSIAVAKGKGLIVQRDSLKQTLAETSGELEKCSEELKLREISLHEVESKLKIYSEAGERVEALESELSYIRNSAAALRESFLHKDSVLQRIEEILEDVDLPEHLHSLDIIDKVDWLARSITGNSLPLTDWDQKSSTGGASYSDGGFMVTDGWKDGMQPSSNVGVDMRKNYEELQSKFYGLAEQNEMLEQSLMERNNMVQRWEEVLDRINMPSHLRSMEPEDRIEWLGSAFSEAHHITTLLEQKVENLEACCGSLTADLDMSRRQICDLKIALQGVNHEKERISGRLNDLIHEDESVLVRLTQMELENKVLQMEIKGLQEKNVQYFGNENRIHIIEGRMKRMQDSIINVLQDTAGNDMISEGIGTESLEELLTKFISKYETVSRGRLAHNDAVGGDSRDNADATHIEESSRDALTAKELGEAVLKKELEEALKNLILVKEERDACIEKHHGLACKVEFLDKKCQELQELLNQEEQKSTSVREKLNVAVRKGKLLVQQRDGMKQTIEELNAEVNHLKAEATHQQNALAMYEGKVNELCTFSERLEALESENVLLRNRLVKTEQLLEEKERALSILEKALVEVDFGYDVDISDPLDKLEHLKKLCYNLQAAVSNSEHESRKSKKAAELLLAELNEVQERNDSLQEDLAKVSFEFEEVSRERKLAEAAILEAFSSIEQLSTVCSKERKNSYAKFIVLKSCIDQLRVSLSEVTHLLANVSSKDLGLLRSLETGLESILKQTGTTELIDLQSFIDPVDIISTKLTNKDNSLATDLSCAQVPDHYDDNEIYGFVESTAQEFVTEIGALREKISEHLISVNDEAKRLHHVLWTVQRDILPRKESVDLMERELTRVKSNENQRDMEIASMQKKIFLLHEACSRAILEIEKQKQQLVGNNAAAGDPQMIVAGQAHLCPEEDFKDLADRLLLEVKDYVSVQAETVESSQKEMKITISRLQKELNEKDIQKERICMELVAQIKEAEAATSRHALDLQSSETRLHDLENKVGMLEEERKLLVERVGELQATESSLIELQGRIISLTDAITTKEQEIEALMQALEEEETQMEESTKKYEELEKDLAKKNFDLENLEASHGKAVKKLSITVTKFDELHHLSADLLTEVEKLQAQLQDKDAEISFLRQEVTRCTNDVLVASQLSSQKNSDEVQGLLTWVNGMISRVGGLDLDSDGIKSSQVHEYREMLKKQIASVVSELEDLREVVQSKDALLQAERKRAEELLRRGETLEASLHEKDSQLNLLKDMADSSKTTGTTSEIIEVEPVMKKWVAPVPSLASQVPSLRKVNNDQLAIAIDRDPDNKADLEDEDDDKVHGFKSLTTSRIVPRFARPATDMIDGLWVSCDRALMRQPALRMAIIIYWAILHALLASFAV